MSLASVFEMVRLSRQLPLAAALLDTIPGVSSAGDTAAGPPWVESEYSSSPPVYPSRKYGTKQVRSNYPSNTRRQPTPQASTGKPLSNKLPISSTNSL